MDGRVACRKLLDSNFRTPELHFATTAKNWRPPLFVPRPLMCSMNELMIDDNGL